MNSLERFRAIAAFEPCDRTLFYEMGYWVDTVRRWYGEGLPQRHGIPEDFDGSDVVSQSFYRRGYRETRRVSQRVLDSDDVDHAVGLDPSFDTIRLNLWMEPEYEPRILQEDAECLAGIDEHGIHFRVWKDHHGMPEFTRYPVETRADFEALKERFQPDQARRLPADWVAKLQEWAQRDYPLRMGSWPCGFFGALRQLVGPERLFYLFHDDPALVHEMVSFFADFWVTLLDRVMPQVRPLHVDRYDIWEDMAYKSGSFISPRMFREFLLPGYQELTGFLRDNGISTILVDCDGNVERLIPLWWEAGVNGVFPLEVTAGMDVVRLRAQFPRFLFFGGIDKRAVAAGGQALQDELEYKLGALALGGFVPFVDHFVPPDVSWANYQEYRSRLAELALGAGSR